MTVIELKNQVKTRIEMVNDAELLEEILNLLDLDTNPEETYKIPVEHLEQLEISLGQMASGQTISNAEVDAAQNLQSGRSKTMITGTRGKVF
jgi:hypothetical protein